MKTKIDNLNQSSGQSDENWWFFRLKLMILEVWPQDDLLTSKIVGFPNSVMDYANLVQISSQSDEKWRF